MRPKLLKISGLNSFVEEQIIDFSVLTGKGLFGIFGPTGSGKSSILDAVTIALYGEISRDTKEFINKETEELYVLFKFTLGKDNIYTVERKLKISDSGGYKTSLSRFVVNEKGEQKIYNGVKEIDNKIEEIIGLNHQDFMRTVVLPQGKFSRFLKLTGRSRRDMLERILGLEEFGERLMKKLKKQKGTREDKKKEIKAVLKKYEEVSEDKIQEEKNGLNKLQAEYEDTVENLKVKTEEYNKYRQIRKFQKELEDFKNRQEKLAEIKEEIEEKKIKLKKVKKAVSIKSDLQRYTECNQKINTNKKEFSNLVKMIIQLSAKKKKLNKEFKILDKKKNNEIPQLSEKKVKIQTALKLKEKNEDIKKNITDKKSEVQNLKDEKNKLQSKLNNIKEKVNRQEEEIEGKENEVEKLQVSSDYRKVINSGLELENNYQQQKEQLVKIEEDKKIITDNINSGKEELDRLKVKLKKIEAELLQSYEQEIKTEKDKKEKFNMQLKILTNKLESKQNKLEKIKKDIKEIEKKNMAGLLARDLEEGELCPVCGATKHPRVAEEVDVDLTDKKEKREELKSEIDSLQEDKTDIASNLKISENNITKFIKEKDNLVASFINTVKDLHQLKFKDFRSHSQLKTSRNEINDEINKSRGVLNNNKDNLEEIEQQLEEQQKITADLKEKYSKNLKELTINSFKEENKQIAIKDEKQEEIQQKLKVIKNSIKENKKNQQILQNKFAEKDKKLLQEENKLQSMRQEFMNNEKEIKDRVGDNDPEKYLDRVKQREKQLQEEVKNKKEEKEKAEEELNNKENRKSTVEDRLDILQKERDELKTLLNKKIAEFNFKNTEQARSYLQWQGSIKNWEQEIKDYANKESKINNNIKRLKKELDGESITKKQWVKIEDEKTSLQKKQGELSEKIGGQKKTITTLKKDLEDKKHKIKEKEEVNHELSLIKEINDLIRGKSFVEFVAIRQLRYIAREASKRLMEITNNRYRLELNEQGEFVICDLYNGGVKRGCNTLSGGETFLTSLALALALSSQIQLKGSSNMEFFFLDEGFGTLDNNLLDIVMNSLEKLQDEKLAVGIISHVEELKNRVPVKLKVDPAKPGIRGTEVEIKYS